MQVSNIWKVLCSNPEDGHLNIFFSLPDTEEAKFKNDKDAVYSFRVHRDKVFTVANFGTVLDRQANWTPATGCSD